MPEYKFKSFFFYKTDSFDRKLDEYVSEQQAKGFEFVDVRFAQSSASGTGMSALVVMRKPG